jgi:pimeloyl-ACP methyl ester carboxylesterase
MSGVAIGSKVERAMPVLKRDDAEIYFEEFGSGYPVLLFAPGGLRSRIEMWHAPAEGPARPWNDWTHALASRYRVVAMDQRNAGRSRGAIAADHGWHTYAGDHLALMDHLGYKRFHTLGGCIGSSYCLKLCEIAPERVSAAVLQNPIGVHPEFPTYFPESHAAWGKEQLAMRTDLDATAMQSFGRNMWDQDFVFSVTRDFARRCEVPCLVLPGDDTPHPAVIGSALAGLLPNAEHLNPWKGPEHLDEQSDRVIGFLEKHTP